jgi:hypothetical protein
MVPIILEVPEGVTVGATVNEIRFQADLLKFEEVTLGDAGIAADAKVETDLQPAKEDPKQSVLTVRVTGTKGMKTGTLASVGFTVAKQAEGTIVLNNKPQAFTPGSSPQPLSPVEGVNGEIQLGAPPVIACFFYMH